MHFESPLPQDMQTVLDKWRHYTAWKPAHEDDNDTPLDKEAVNNMK